MLTNACITLVLALYAIGPWFEGRAFVTFAAVIACCYVGSLFLCLANRFLPGFWQRRYSRGPREYSRLAVVAETSWAYPLRCQLHLLASDLYDVVAEVPARAGSWWRASSLARPSGCLLVRFDARRVASPPAGT